MARTLSPHHPHPSLREVGSALLWPLNLLTDPLRRQTKVRFILTACIATLPLLVIAFCLLVTAMHHMGLLVVPLTPVAWAIFDAMFAFAAASALHLAVRAWSNGEPR